MFRYLTRLPLRTPLALACVLALPALGCTDTLLNVTDPDIVLGANSAASAIGLANGAALRLTQAGGGTQGPAALSMFRGRRTNECWPTEPFYRAHTSGHRVW